VVDRTEKLAVFTDDYSDPDLGKAFADLKAAQQRPFPIDLVGDEDSMFLSISNHKTDSIIGERNATYVNTSERKVERAMDAYTTAPHGLFLQDEELFAVNYDPDDQFGDSNVLSMHKTSPSFAGSQKYPVLAPSAVVATGEQVIVCNEQGTIEVFDRLSAKPSFSLNNADSHIKTPKHMFLTQHNELYVCDTGNHRILVFQ